jgi:two-component system, cell cycle sensor histidine kinase and response regulator CckA
MSTSPIPSAEAERLRALHGYDILDTPPEAPFDELVALAARICGTPISLVSLIDRNRQWFKARYGLALTETPRVMSFCTHVLSRPGELLIVPDATLDPRFAGNPLVTGEAGIRFYAGVPLRTAEGYTVGTLCVLDRQPRILDPEQQAALRVLGRQVMANLELRRSLNEAILNETRLKTSQRIAGLGDWEYDFIHSRLAWSEEVYRILGVSRKDSPPNPDSFYRRVHPDDLAFVHREKKAAAEGSRLLDFEHRVIRPDGAVRHVHQITEMVFDDQGQPALESGTIQDVTERKRSEEALRQSEERFKLVARAVSDVIWDWNIVTDDLWWSDGFTTTFGYVISEIEPGLESWTSRIHPDELRRVVDGLHHAVDTGVESWTAEYRFRCKNGSYALVQHSGHISRDAAGRGARVVGGLRDLTEQKEMEAQYLRAQRMVSIGTLAGGIAHDLNNVLTPIMMSIELLKFDSGNDPGRDKILGTIQASCQRGAALVRQVLAFARGVDGKRVVIGLRNLMDDLKGIIGETFPRNITIVTDVPDELWPIVGDATQLHQVLLNLAVNARDAMPRGGRLTVAASNVTLDAQHAGTHREAKPGPYVVLQVSDTGVGIPLAIRERIFEPFFTTKEIGKGTGLGLPTVHAIVKSHGGFMTIDSEVDLGTTCKVYLPADPAQQSTETGRPLPADLPRGRGELVLVVDDEFAIRHIAQQTLEAFGYRVITAADGAKAVGLYTAQAQQIAVVLVDMMMPIMDGAATIKALTRINPSVRFISASGLGVTEDFNKATSGGVNDSLPKPYSAEALLRRIRDVLDRPASKRD